MLIPRNTKSHQKVNSLVWVESGVDGSQTGDLRFMKIVGRSCGKYAMIITMIEIKIKIK